MSYTNTTPNYELPQFEASDRMTPVADFNGAFSAIDTALKTNADNIADLDSDVADAKSDAENALSTANSVASTANNALLQAQTANTTAGNALSTANGATTTANSAKATAEASAENLADEFDSSETYSVGDYVIYEGVLYRCTVAHTGDFVSSDFTAVKIVDEMGGGGSADYDSIFNRMFNMSSTSATITPESGITVTSNTFMLAKNSDSSLFKLYGYATFTRSATTSGNVKLGTLSSNLGTRDTAITMRGLMFDANLGGNRYALTGWIVLETDGTISIYVAIPVEQSGYVTAYIPPCIFVAENFGD